MRKSIRILIFLIISWACAIASPSYVKISKPPKIKTKKVHVIKHSKPKFFSQSPEEGLMEALKYYGVKHPEIVYAQAVLETGNFKSNLCLNKNNLFGLYNSKAKRYYRFNHWSESIESYVNDIQDRYRPPNNYYKFLSDIGYAEDPNYIKKIKKIVNDKRRSEQLSSNKNR